MQDITYTQLTCVLIEVTAPLVCQSTMSGRWRDALRGGWYVRIGLLEFLLFLRECTGGLF